MAFKDQAVNLILKAKNLMSSETDAAADSVENLGDSAEALKDKLRTLEDQGRLVKQFEQSGKAVDRAGTAYKRLQDRAEKMGKKLEESSDVTAEQTREWYELQDAVGQAEADLKKAQGTMDRMGKEAEEAGVEVEDLAEAQRKNKAETIKARRAIADFNEETERGTGRLASFRQGLSDGIATFIKWGAAAAAATAAASVVVLSRLTSQQADLARQTLATSSALGIGTDALQEWQYAAARVGLENDKVADSLKDVSEKIGDAYLNGGGEAAEAIKALNINLEDLVRLSPEKQLLKIAEGLNGLPKSGQIQVLETLASDASLLLPLLDDNAAKLKELSALARERGLLVSEEDLKKLAKTDEAFKQIADRLTEFKKKLSVELAPTFTQIADDFDEFLENSPGLVENIVTVFTGLISTTKRWVDAVLGSRDEIGAAFNSIKQTLSFFGSSATLVFRGVQALASQLTASVFGVSTAFAGLVELATRGANLVGLASDEAVASASARTNALAATTLDLVNKTKDYASQAVAAGKSAATAFDETGSGAKSAADLIRSAAEAAKDLVDSNGDVAAAAEAANAQTESLKQNQDELSREILKTAAAIELTNQKWSEDPSDENLATLDALKSKYKELQDIMAGIQAPDLGGDQPGDVDSSLVNQFRKMTGAADDATKATGRAVDRVGDLGREADQAGGKIQRVGQDAVESAGSVGASIGAIGAGWANYINNLSQKAGAAFQEKLGFKQAASDASALEGALATVTARLDDMDGRISSGGTISALLRKWARAGFETEQSFLQQAIAVEKLTDKILAGDRSANELRLTAEQLESRFNLLDGSQLAPLIGAIQSARREIDSLNDSLLDTIASAEQELASLRGDQEEVERLRYLERQQELQDQLNNARQLGDSETIKNAERALSLANEAYNLRLEEAKKRTDQARQEQLDYEQRQAQQRQVDEREERQDISRTEQRTQTQTTQLARAFSDQRVTLDLRANGSSLGSLSGIRADEVEALIQAIRNSTFVTTG